MRSTGFSLISLLCAAFSLSAVVGCQAPSSSDDTAVESVAAKRGDQPGRPANMLLITLDTTRADRLGCYGNDDIRTPNIDGLAREGVLFEQAYSVQPVTLPSHTSMLTGQYPFTHGVRDNSVYKVKADTVTLAERLKHRGYLTVAFVSAYILDHRYGLDQGFDYYNDRFIAPKQRGRLPVDRRASEVSLLATDWLELKKDDVAGQPFFMWLHYYDPHADYDPPEPYRSAYPNPYDGEIAYTDDWLGFLFDNLRRRDLWDNTLVVLMADHGDSLGDHGEQTHGIFIYSATTHVPLLMRYPARVPKGRRISDRVSGVDLVPTILELLGMPSGDEMDGVSLVELITQQTPLKKRPVYSEVFIPRSFGWSELRGIREGPLFYIEAPIPELYEAEAEWTIQPNLCERDPGSAAILKEALASLTSTELDPRESGRIELDDTAAARLQALGYFISAGAEAQGEIEPVTLPDPKTRVAIFNRYQQATSLLGRGGHKRAIPVLREVVSADPGNPRFEMDLASALLQNGDYPESERLLLRLIQDHPEDARYRFLLGKAYLATDQKDKALSAFEKVLELEPEHFQAQFRLSMLHIHQQQWSEAKSALEGLRERQPRNVAVLNNLAYVLIKGEGRVSEGITMISEALSWEPQNISLLVSLGSAHLSAGDPQRARKLLERAVKIAPENAQALAQLAQLYQHLGDAAGLEKLNRRRQLMAHRE